MYRGGTIMDPKEYFSNSEGWTQERATTFVNCVYDYLDCRGYFISDFDGHPGSENKEKKCRQDFGNLLLDMALQYNMEHGKQYKVELNG